MSKSKKEIQFLRYVGLMLTYKCQIACRHCIVHAGPHRKEEMRINDIKNWIGQLASYREKHVKALAITGGEPFFNIDLLRETITIASEPGLLITVVTNAHWAQSFTRAKQILQSLPGINVLSFSTDSYHLELIPIENIENAAEAAEDLGVEWSITVSTHNENDPEYLRTVERIIRFAPHDRIIIGPTFPVGRAQKELGTTQFKTGSKPSGLACDRGGSPIIFPNGRVVSCVGPVIDLSPGHPLELGNLQKESMEEIFNRAEKNVLLHTIRVWGPRKLIGLLNGSGLTSNLTESYIQDCPCDACYKLIGNKVLRERLHSIANDPDFALKLAYARAHYMNEPEMLFAMDLVNHCEALK